MKTFVGIVVRTKNAKTAHVEINTEWMHPKYLKKVRQSKVFACQDDIGVHTGDEVQIAECKPVSATKFFKVEKVIKQKAVRNLDEVLKEEKAPDVAEAMTGKEEKKVEKKTKKQVTKK